MPEHINGKGWTHFPFVTCDGKQLYFASDRHTPGMEDIYCCDLNGNTWGNVVQLNNNINTERSIEQSPSLTSDGQNLYFVRYTAKNSYDIFCSTWQDTGWGPAVNIGPPVNTRGMEWSCCISPDGNKLFFSSYHYIDSMSPPDICVSMKTDSGWTDPELLFPDFDSNLGPDDAPSLSSDGQTLYFKRAFRVKEERDIYYSVYNGETWSKPVNAGTPINSPQAEMTPAISPDGRALYFSYLDLNNQENHPARPQIYVSYYPVSRLNFTYIILIPDDPNPHFNQKIKLPVDTIKNELQIQIEDLKGNPVLNTTVKSDNSQHYWMFNPNKNDITQNHLAYGLYICKLTKRNNLYKLIKVLRLRPFE